MILSRMSWPTKTNVSFFHRHCRRSSTKTAGQAPRKRFVLSINQFPFRAFFFGKYKSVKSAVRERVNGPS